jgi:hypothetical protein
MGYSAQCELRPDVWFRDPNVGMQAILKDARAQMAAYLKITDPEQEVRKTLPACSLCGQSFFSSTVDWHVDDLTTDA